jgi:3-deoxy-manno-octulosonate cytidylyltransferase (CMP-KDO synthetase)
MLHPQSMATMVDSGFRIVIPARYGASRLPGKPLRRLAGRPLIEHVHGVAQSSGAERVVIATDDARIVEVAEGFGAEVCLTSTEHASGTDRLAEVVELLDWPNQTVVVNLQGDEPLLPAALLTGIADALRDHPDAGIATLCSAIHDPDELFDPNVVKVVRDAVGAALYFSRAPIPWSRDGFAAGRPSTLPSGAHWWRHIGVYAYRVEALRAYPRLPASALEATEMLEQLRALAAGIRIQVLETTGVPPAGVDTEADLARVERLLVERRLQEREAQ